VRRVRDFWNLDSRRRAHGSACLSSQQHGQAHAKRGQAALSFGGSYESRTLAEAAGLSMAELWERFAFDSMPSGPRGTRATLAGGMVYCNVR
jgi:hypothetical protein